MFRKTTTPAPNRILEISQEPDQLATSKQRRISINSLRYHLIPVMKLHDRYCDAARVKGGWAGPVGGSRRPIEKSADEQRARTERQPRRTRTAKGSQQWSERTSGPSGSFDQGDQVSPPGGRPYQDLLSSPLNDWQHELSALRQGMHAIKAAIEPPTRPSVRSFAEAAARAPAPAHYLSSSS